METILTAAARVFAQRGYAGGTTNHIAARAGVSVGSLYEYFPNKDALLVALMERHLEESETLLSTTLSSVFPSDGTLPPLRLLVQALVDSAVRLHADSPRLHRVLFEEAPRPPRIKKRLEALEASLCEGVASLLSIHPEVRAPSPSVAAAMVVRTVESLTHRAVLDDLLTPELPREMTRMLCAYLTAEGPTD
ncbi:Transcriptional regulator, TetR family [Myxococcus hansupus]|uniref:Transcriptional regulator, TetR family n=1 Tax=Pseudomyxococcus hansupus TaxID=1297742 RepID=A0A0H4X9N9_9BACT|nr:Transcriptional regulator, TetR family [Myxococcus hansupus]